MTQETAFELAASSVRFGSGVTREVGAELADRGARRVLLVTDPLVSRLKPVEIALEALAAERLSVEIYDAVRTEPSDSSFRHAIGFAAARTFDAIVAVGGGSTIDTAKAVNLYTTYPPRDFLDYVNAPIGKGHPVPGALKPLIAIPTTAGTGSETTGVAILDVTSLGAKTGISSPRLKPTLGLLDPDNTRTMPPRVAAFTGLDVLCHAIESYTALPYTGRPRVDRPSLRPTYQGANPISDVWSLEALRLVSRFLVRAVRDPSDDEARGKMLLAASYAGLGFGNAGVHLPHAMSYPVAGRVKNYRPDGYAADHPLVPHGLSVILNAPAVFRFTAPASPARHLLAAAALGSRTSRGSHEDAGRILADRIVWFLKELELPRGLRDLGYTTTDVPALVEGALLQRRLTTLSPRPVGADELSSLFEEALEGW
jgi:hydroxyacid-oxoacid transhydrogenase